MAKNKLVWDQAGEKLYETGVEKCALYVQAAGGTYPEGVAWNGVTGVTESPSGAEATALYADNKKYVNLMSAEELGATLEAYTYPDEFAQCDGSAEIAPGVMIGQQARMTFGLAYKTLLGNDTDSNDYGYKLHIIYGASASPSDKGYSSVNDSPEAITFSWELKTTPVNVAGLKPTASVVIDSTKTDKAGLKALEAILFGCDAFSETSKYAVGDAVTYEDKVYSCVTAVTTVGAWSESNWTEIGEAGPRLPLPDEIANIMKVHG